MTRRKRRRFTPEHKADAVKLVSEVGSIRQVAKDLDLTETALRHWVKQAEIDVGQGPEGALTTEERDELRRLRREVKVLEQEREFLKKAATLQRARSRTSVRAASGGEGQLPNHPDVPRPRNLGERLLQVVQRACSQRRRKK